MQIKVKYIGEDDWGRKTYQNLENKSIYKDVDGRLHTSSPKEGEPECPLKKDLNIIEVRPDGTKVIMPQM